MFKKTFSFNGRIRRLEYGLTYLFYIIISTTTELLIETNFSTDTAQIIYIILVIPILWIMFAQGAKRCHDRGNSGWYQIIPFYVFWMLFADGDYGINEYGENPKGKGNHDEINEIGGQIENE